ncbi:dual adapter for phosphotyrosine and 3-phosphotyrosine and 3-phosphoinositide [Pyxicephalus adspersus]|uniref:dual adapter for phosphotyrosine and 3-phosphotyrosine and 3-phosphoinositide n=1 Tax=Pyxicephalus adspersus TaxID=30357 RepID=UPI003B5AD1EC
MTYRAHRVSWREQEEYEQPEKYCQDQPDENELESLGWFHENLTRHSAEALLLTNGQDGSYLLRKSDSKANVYSLSVRLDMLRSMTPRITQLFFSAGTLILLKYPYPREVEEPSIYESVRVHTAMQSGRSESDLVPLAPSLGTKEGYLTKQGGRVKTWKTRWFILSRNELKYYKDQMAQEPIKTLDLTECSAVQFDYSQERVNCFCLVFPVRTYYLCAKTGAEADEWIKILRWKMSQIKRQTTTRR